MGVALHPSPAGACAGLLCFGQGKEGPAHKPRRGLGRSSEHPPHHLSPQASQKYWGPASPMHKLPPIFAGNKDGERALSGEGARRRGVPRRTGEPGPVLVRGSVCAPAELIHHMDEVNDELMKKISHIKAQPQRHFRVERSQPVHLPLTFESGPDEVRAWLEAKAFSSR